MTKNKPLKKLSTTLPDTKTPNYFVEKVERTPAPAEISCGADNSGQRYVKTSCQMPMNKCNKIGKWSIS